MRVDPKVKHLFVGLGDDGANPSWNESLLPKAWIWTEAEEGLREEGGCVQGASEAGKGAVRREDG